MNESAPGRKVWVCKCNRGVGNRRVASAFVKWVVEESVQRNRANATSEDALGAVKQSNEKQVERGRHARREYEQRGERDGWAGVHVAPRGCDAEMVCNADGGEKMRREDMGYAGYANVIAGVEERVAVKIEHDKQENSQRVHLVEARGQIEGRRYLERRELWTIRGEQTKISMQHTNR